MTARSEPAVEDSLDAITDALLTGSRLLVAISARSIARVDETITIPPFRTLVILAARSPINVKTLAGLLHVQRSTTGRMVERLVTAGLIDRRPHPVSRRELVVVDRTRAGDRVRGHRASPLVLLT
jgi:DNA-binding MarR family transcriptional regulator